MIIGVEKINHELPANGTLRNRYNEMKYNVDKTKCCVNEYHTVSTQFHYKEVMKSSAACAGTITVERIGINMHASHSSDWNAAASAADSAEPAVFFSVCWHLATACALAALDCCWEYVHCRA